MHSSLSKDNKSQNNSHKNNKQATSIQFKDNRSENVTQLHIQDLANKKSQQDQPVQKKENKTGLPDNLKTGIESLSGHAMDDVKVHYNSSKPAQLQAHAYAQGTDIHIGPSQEKHLPHEAWHVVQQKQGRVQPTIQMKGKVNVNDDTGLEREADTMGAKALHTKAIENPQLLGKPTSNSGTIQRKGERVAVAATHTGGGNTNQMRRGNRRGSISLTHGGSRSKLAAFRHYAYPPNTKSPDRMNKLKLDIVQAATNKLIPNPNTWYKNNYERIIGYAAQVIGIGNCGEFGSAVFGELVKNTTNQYVAKCAMHPSGTYDHCFVLTLDQHVNPGATLPTNINTKTTTVADGWHGHRVMTLEQFFNTKNAYGAQISYQNIWINACQQATGTDELGIQNIKTDIEAFANRFNIWNQAQLANPNSSLSKLKTKAHTDADSGARSVAGMFGTDGSDSAPLQDIRPMENKLVDNDVPQNDKNTLVNNWWTGTNNDNITTFSQNAKTAFDASVQLQGLNITNLTAAKRLQFLNILSINDTATQLGHLTNTQVFDFLNTKNTATKAPYLDRLPAAKVKAYITASWGNTGGWWAFLGSYPYKQDIIRSLGEQSFKSYIGTLDATERQAVTGFFAQQQRTWYQEKLEEERLHNMV